MLRRSGGLAHAKFTKLAVFPNTVVLLYSMQTGEYHYYLFRFSQQSSVSVPVDLDPYHQPTRLKLEENCVSCVVLQPRDLHVLRVGVGCRAVSFLCWVSMWRSIQVIVSGDAMIVLTGCVRACHRSTCINLALQLLWTRGTRRLFARRWKPSSTSLFVQTWLARLWSLTIVKSCPFSIFSRARTVSTDTHASFLLIDTSTAHDVYSSWYIYCTWCALILIHLLYMMCINLEAAA